MEKLQKIGETTTDERDNVWFTIDYDGSVEVHFLEHIFDKKLKYHVGDFDAISKATLKYSKLIDKLSTDSIENEKLKFYQDNIDMAESFQKLINYCFQTLTKVISMMQYRKFKLFEVTFTYQLFTY